MWSPLPPDPGNLKYWNEEAKRRREVVRSGGLPFELIRLLWFWLRSMVVGIPTHTSLVLLVAKAQTEENSGPFGLAE